MEIMLERDVRQWFGNRGIELEESKLTFAAIEKDGNRWLFILDDCFDYEGHDEIELYNLDASCCECYDAWKAKAFDWDVTSIMAKIDDN